MREIYPNAVFAAHPECRSDVIRHADYIGSTKGILDFVEHSDRKEFIIGTEKGVVDRLAVTAPDKTCYLLTPRFVCPNMKKTRIADVADSLEKMRHVIELPPETMELARIPLERMVALG
jgi:quinolinate synthase